MCFEGKCCCLKLEMGTLVFGIISSFLSGFLIITTIGGIIALNIIAIQNIQPDRYQVFGDSSSTYTSVDYRPMLCINLFLFGVLLKSMMDFTFTVLLCNGVTRRNPSYIKAYFIYGIVMAVLCSAVMVGIAIVVESFIVALVSFVILILYSLILHMVNLTRQKISGEVFALENKRLTDTIF